MHLDIFHWLLACMYAIERPFRPFSSILPAYAGGSPHGLLLASWLVGFPLGIYLAHPPQVTSVSWITNISFPQGIWVGSVQHPPLESYSSPSSPCGLLSASLPPGSSHRVHLHGSFDFTRHRPQMPFRPSAVGGLFFNYKHAY